MLLLAHSRYLKMCDSLYIYKLLKSLFWNISFFYLIFVNFFDNLIICVIASLCANTYLSQFTVKVSHCTICYSYILNMENMWRDDS